MLIQAHEEWAVWARGTGKSEGLIAPRSQHNIHAMRRATGVFVGATYQQLLTRTLPPVIAGWEKMGYKKDIHYFIGRKPPQSWKWDSPRVAPLSNDYFIHWYQGSGIHLVSQDRAGSSNGLSIDWIMGDEAKLLNKEKLEQELFQTNRGNREHYGHLPEHHSLLFATDMPTSASAKWILDKREEMDMEQINLILSIQEKIYSLTELYNKSTKTTQKRIIPEINRYTKYLNEVRVGSVYYSEFSALENLEVLGVDYIKQQRRILPEIVFRTSILGERIIQVANGFYGLFDANIHGYDAFDYAYLDSQDYNFEKLTNIDCRQDADLNQEWPLDIACDYGASINTVVVGQGYEGRDEEELRYVNALFVKHPDRIQDLATKFCDYYSTYKNKHVYYYYDHTAVGTDAGRSTPLYMLFVEVLEARGWQVTPIYIGQAPLHHGKYILWQMALKGDDPRLPKPRFNKTNCKYLIISMEQAEVTTGKTGFEKDKRNEKNKALPQEETTHFSDAADTLYFGKYAERLKGQAEFSDVLYR
jgi:hypothetical protein